MSGYRIEALVSIDGGPWEIAALRVTRLTGRAPSTRRAVADLKAEVAHRRAGGDTARVRVKGTRVLATELEEAQ